MDPWMAFALGSKAVDFATGLGTNVINYGMQKEAWKREDTAIQRRVKDLAAAGLSPNLAAGGGAQASAPIQVSMPPMNLFETGSKAARTGAEISAAKTQAQAATMELLNTVQQNALLKQQTAESYQRTNEAMARTGEATERTRQVAEATREVMERIKGIDLDNREKRWNLEQAMSSGVSTNTSGVVKQVAEGGRLGSKLINDLIGELKKIGGPVVNSVIEKLKKYQPAGIGGN